MMGHGLRDKRSCSSSIRRVGLSALAALCLTTLLCGIAAIRPAAAEPAAVQVGGFSVSGGVEGVDYELRDITLMSQGRNITHEGPDVMGKELPTSGAPRAILSDAPYLVIKTSTPLVISNIDPAVRNETGIFIEKGVKADLTFDNVNIYNSAPVYIETNSGNTAENANMALLDGSLIPDDQKTALHLVLADGSENTLYSAGSSSFRYPALRCGEGSILVIDDAVPNVDVSGNHITPEGGRIPAGTTYRNRDGEVVTASYDENDALSYLDSAQPGKLNATSGDRSTAIGSCVVEESGDMTFDGGIITANSSSGSGLAAGIGGSQCGGNTLITINGGEIYATGGYHGAGVGSGCTGGGGVGGIGYIAPDGILGRRPAATIAGDIIINGGYIESRGGVHGNGFGGGCRGVLNGKTILITGGTLLPSAGLYDIGGSGGDVIITGGSVKTPGDFISNAAKGYAYGAYSIVDGKIVPDTSNLVQMAQINLSSYGEGAKNAIITNFDMSVAGIGRDYGLPNRTDANGNLYLWIGASAGKEISVDLGVESSETGEPIKTDTFFVPDWANKPNVLLKQYYPFEVTRDQLGLEALDKRYDGLNFDISGLADKFGSAEDGKLAIPVDNPPNSFINDPADMTVASQMLARTWEGDAADWPAAENAPIIQGDGEDPEQTNSNVGKYQVIVTSTQYGNVGGAFGNSFYGHRAYAKYMEITPADVDVSISSNPASGAANQTFELAVKVRPADGEAQTCKAPEGKVQLFANGVPVGEPIELVPAVDGASGSQLTDAEGWHYSTATMEWMPASTDFVGSMGEAGSLGELELTARYIGCNSEEATAEYLDTYQINYNEAATADSVIFDIDPIEPAAPGENGLGFEIHVQGPDGEDKGAVKDNHLSSSLDEGGVNLGGYLVDADGSLETGCTYEIVDEHGNPVDSSVAEVDPVTGEVTFNSGGTVHIKVTRPGDSVLTETSQTITIDIFDSAVIIVKEDPSSSDAFAWDDVVVGQPIVDELDRLGGNEATQWAEDIAAERGEDFLGWTTDPDSSIILGPNDSMPNGPTTVYPVFGDKADADGIDAGQQGTVSIFKAVENTTSADGANRPGDVLHYTVTAKNNTLAVWDAVEMADRLPAGVELVTDSLTLIVVDDLGQRTEYVLNPGEYAFDAATNTLSYTIDSIQGGWTYELGFDAVIQMDALTGALAGKPVENAASIVGDNEEGGQTGGSTEVVVPGDDGIVTPNDPGRSVAKAAENLTDADGARTQVGDRVRYTISLTNTAAWSIWEDAALYDLLPVGVEPDAASFVLTLPDGTVQQVPAGAYDPESRVLYVVVGDIATDETVTFAFEATLSEEALGSDIGNIAWAGDGGVTGEGGFGEDGKPEDAIDSGDATYPLEGDMETPEDTVLPATPEPRLLKTIDGAAQGAGYVKGDTVAFRISLGNDAAGSLWSDAEITDVLPAGLELDVASIELLGPDGSKRTVNADAYDAPTRTLRVHVGEVWGGEEYVLTYRCTVDAAEGGASELVNRAGATGVTPDEPLEQDPASEAVVKIASKTGQGAASGAGGSLPSTGDLAGFVPFALAGVCALAGARALLRRDGA